MSARTYALRTTEIDHWRAILERCGRYDVYHTAEYHCLAEEHGAGQAVLLACERSGTVVAMPLLLREITGLPGIESRGLRLANGARLRLANGARLRLANLARLCDVTSAHGYAGPVCSAPRPSQAAIEAFGSHLLDYLAQHNAVCAFSRLHPLLEGQEALLSATGGQVLGTGQTVAIDLSLPMDEQWRQYRENHKRDIRKAEREGVRCIHDAEWRYLDAFVEMYDRTMQRVHASPFYLFDRSYFDHLCELLRGQVHLFVTLQDDAVSSAALFTVCNGIIQYFLGATDSRFVRSSPSKLLFDTVRRWGTARGASTLHLGGGVGARPDSLLHFKAGFSSLRCSFQTWQLVLDATAYQQLVDQRTAWNQSQGLESADPDYFPAYRGPSREARGMTTDADGR